MNREETTAESGVEPSQESTEETQELLQDQQTQQDVVEDLEVLQEQEQEDFEQKYFRLLADMENLRKRSLREKIESNKYAVRGLIRDVLGPFDSMENALKYAQQTEGEVKMWAQGFVMILDQFKEILASHGVTSFSCVGDTFDPHRHEAIDTQETTEVEPGKVLEEYQKGYLIQDEVLRVAKVKVSRSPQEEESTQINPDQKV